MNRNNPFGEGAPRILGVFAHPDEEKVNSILTDLKTKLDGVNNDYSRT